MADLDQALQDILTEIGQLPNLITQAVQAAVAAANSGDAAALQAALQHQQNVADSLEQGVAAIQAAFNVPAPAAPDPIALPPAGAPAPDPIVVTDTNGQPVNGALTPQQAVGNGNPVPVGVSPDGTTTDNTSDATNTGGVSTTEANPAS